ncbi:MAG: SDR family oxidoreductase [bacterium]|nr:SDR family oxidoreductase [bacterium]
MDSSKTTKTALITGGSSGIGFELARQFARDNVQLVLVARNEAQLTAAALRLSEEYGVRVMTMAHDLSEKGSAQRIFERTQSDGIAVDYLVNNAGFGLFGEFLELPLADELAMLEVNCAGLTGLCKLYGKEMVSRRSGRVLNVASTAAFQPGPLMAVYYASKSYVLSLSEALNCEVKGTGVTVTCICPGPTPTGFQARAGNQKSGLMKLAVTTPEEVARAGYRGMLRGKSVVVPGLMNTLVMQGVRALPRDVVTAISRFTAKSR